MSSGILRERSWRWFIVRLHGLLSKPPILVVTDPGTRRQHQVPPTRIGLALNPIKQ